MEFLKFLEGLRTPFLDGFFSLITHCGEEFIFMGLGLVLLWCVNKRQGYFILLSGLFGVVTNQFLKILFRVPRPWVLDKDFTIVESARAEATGYSFPSGHTHASINAFGGLAVCRKEKWIRAVGIVICLLVPLSRLYLGVHTPADVLVSAAITLLILAAFYPLTNWGMKKDMNMRIILWGLTICTAAYVAFVQFYPFPADTDAANYSSSLENGYKMLGLCLGVLPAFEIDTRFTKFSTEGSFLAQLIKIVGGLGGLLIIKGLLKSPLHALIGNVFVADGIRYFLIAVFALGIWPMTFKFFAKINGKTK